MIDRLKFYALKSVIILLFLLIKNNVLFQWQVLRMINDQSWIIEVHQVRYNKSNRFFDNQLDRSLYIQSDMYMCIYVL